MLTRLPNAACVSRAPVRLAHRHPAPRTARSCVVRAAKLQKFVGCNSYFLLEQASYGNLELVEKTLEAIKQAGFTVVRTWGFNNDPDKSRPLQNNPQAPGNYDPSKSEAEQMAVLGINKQALDAFDKVLGIAQDHGLKLMICLTNSLADYGGMPQFVRWSGYVGNPPIPPYTKLDDLSWEQKQDLRRNFWGSSSRVQGDAQAHCRNYITFMVTHVNRVMHENGWDCVHSWDICNEPRLPDFPSGQPAGSTAEITTWVNGTVALVKGLEKKLARDGVGKEHLVTVGSEGFWGAADVNNNNPLRANPYGSGVIEGSDWRAMSSSIDFVCIHPYADQWNHLGDALQFNCDWITGHVAACTGDDGIGKPLVIQEYNMPSQLAGQRSDYFNFVKKEIMKPESPLVGAMVWMVGDAGYQGDQYMIHPDTAAGSDWQLQVEMCQAVNDRPSPS